MVDLHEKYTQKTRIKFYTNKNFPLRFQKFVFIFSCIFVCIFYMRVSRLYFLM